MGKVMNVLAALVETAGAVVHIGAGGPVKVAKVRSALDAGLATSAGGDEGQDHLVPRLHGGDARPHLLNGARAFMPQHYRQHDRSVAVHEMAVAAADPRRADLDQHLLGFRIVQFHVFDHQRGLSLIQYRCLHHRAS